MNILIPHSWLLDHLETEADPATIQRVVSLSGPSIERIYDREGESVYDIEVTTNRVDSMSVRGIAREVAVILQQSNIPAQLKKLTTSRDTLTHKSTEKALPEIKNSPQWCQRIVCVVLTNVQHAPTPEWMAKRLRQIEQNVHDSVIDITNYVTHELGHPCHAFDYDKIMELGGSITVKEATAGVSFTTLDGASYTTKGGEIIFVNKDGTIIDLPAIKGTANTAVDDGTSNVLLWIESLDAAKVRAASMSHAIRTVAAQLNEKNVDPMLAEPTSLRSIELYQQLCSAETASEIYDENHAVDTKSVIRVSIAAIERYMGISLDPANVRAMLEALECTVSQEGETLVITPPSFRGDLQTPVDVVEEIARLYGYHNIPSVLMPTAIPTELQPNTNFMLEERAKRFLAASGAQELYTYSMVSEALARLDGEEPQAHLKLANPLTDDRVYMRRSLVPSLIEALSEMQRPDQTVFELANVYHPQEGARPDEVLHLAIVSTANYRDVRATVEALLHVLHIPQVEIVYLGESTQQADIRVTDVRGQQHTVGTVREYPHSVIAFDLIWKDLLKAAATHPHYQPLPKAAPLSEDLTFTIPEGVAIGPLIASMKEQSPLLAAVDLHSVYERNLTFHYTYLDPEKPVGSEAVAPVRTALVALMQEKAGATLVGTLQPA